MKRMRIKAITACLFIIIYTILCAYPVSAQDFSLFFGRDYNTWVIECDHAALEATDNGLVFTPDVTFPPYPSATLPYSIIEDDYVYSCRFTFLSSYSSNCPFALSFGENEQEKLLLSLTKGAVAELASLNDAGEWNVLYSESLLSYKGTDKISPSKFIGSELAEAAELELSVVVKDGYVFIYVDGVLIGEASTPDLMRGEIGFAGHGCSVLIKSISVSYTLPRINSVSQSYDTELYSNKSLNPLVFSYDNGETKGSVNSVIFDVKSGDGVLYAYHDGKHIDTLASRIDSYRQKTILSFYLSDNESAELFSTFADENNIHDSYIISSSESCIKKAIGTSKFRRGVLDLSSASSVSVDECTQRLYSLGIRTLILSKECADFDTVYAFRRRMINVFVKSSASYYDLLSCDCDGIITDTPEQLAEFAEKTCGGNIYSPPVVIPKATGLEDINNYSSVGAIYMDARLEGDAISCGTLSLDEVYEQLKGSDCVLYLVSNTADKAFCDILNEFNEKNGSATRIFALLSSPLAQYCTTLASVYAHIYPSSMPAAENASTTVFELQALLAAAPSAFITNDGINDELMLGCKSRGFTACLFGDGEGYFAYFTENGEKYKDEIMSISASVDKGGKLDVVGLTYDGEKISLTAQARPVVIDGEIHFDGTAVTGTGTFAAEVSIGEHGLISPSVYFSPISGSDSLAEPSDGGEGVSIVTLAVISIVVIVTVVGLIVFSVLRKKRK